MTQSPVLLCALCDTAARDAEVGACERCGGSTVFRYDGLPIWDAEPPPERGIWRYRARLPAVPENKIVSLGEGATPLTQLKHWAQNIGLTNVHAKLEYAGPTGSFKDRGASVLISRAAAIGATHVVEDSSGNAGAAIAAYAAAAGIRCTVFVPASTPPAKLHQMRAYGASIESVEGPRTAAERAARDAARSPDSYYAGHNVNPYFVEGCKTLGFELGSLFHGRGPDHVVIPVGGGSLFVGAALGFRQWAYGNPIIGHPRMHLVQAEACMPLVAAYVAGSNAAMPIVRGPTVAGGIEIESPARAALILRLLRETGGAAVAVSETAILMAQAELARQEGLFMEPTSAVAFAGLARLASSGTIGRDESVVVAVTGSGLKDTTSAMSR